MIEEKILSVSQIREADAYTIENEPIKSVDLMERASQKCSSWISKNYSTKNKIAVVCGIGNNGGDGLAISRQLFDKGFKHISVFIINYSQKYSPDFTTNLERLKKIKKIKIKIINIDINDFNLSFFEFDIIIDCIFGTGLSRVIDNKISEIISIINKSKKTIISIDMPSGLFADKITPQSEIIKANNTLTFQFVKFSMFFAESFKHTGKITVLDIKVSKSYIKIANTDKSLILFSNIIIKDRDKFSHKGSFGHGLLIAGKYGMMGAAVLSSKSCLKSGIGLLTTHCIKSGLEILQTSVPECLVSIDKSLTNISELPELSNYDAIAIGPGIGKDRDTLIVLKQLLSENKKPIIIDADAINLLSENKELYKYLNSNTILTPHPKEFDRLAGKSKNSFERYEKLKLFSNKNSVFVILKGAHSIVSTPEGKIFFNTTGNNGMATAGSGDVLTGIILSLLSQNYKIEEACKTAIFLHGLAGDIYAKNESTESLTASDIIKNIGLSFKVIKKKKSKLLSHQV